MKTVNLNLDDERVAAHEEELAAAYRMPRPHPLVNHSVMLSLAEIKEWHAIKHAHLGDPQWRRMQELCEKRWSQYGRSWAIGDARDRMSRAVSAFFHLAQESTAAEQADHEFDAGEWSGPAHARLFERNAEELARNFGYNGFDHFHSMVGKRTTGKWAHFNLT
jgi:hypothetical protein